MSSIKRELGGSYQYAPLSGFDTSCMADQNVLLMIIDGLGYEYLKKHGKGSFLYENLRAKMTSVFPATTAAALTTLATGVAPQQHAITGWFMYLKEIGMVTTILPFTSRAGGFKLDKRNIKFNDIFSEKTLFEDTEVSSICILHKAYSYSECSQATHRGAEIRSFATLKGFFKKIRKALRFKGNRKFVYAYWDGFDAICHKQGTESKAAEDHFHKLDKGIAALFDFLKNKNTTVIVTADHGLIDVRESDKVVDLANHLEFVETLAMPLSGEPRAVYCFVRPHKVDKFIGYVETVFKGCCDMYRSEDLINENWFGLFNPSPRLWERIGDYILVMKDNYIMKDHVLGENRHPLIGNHGGLSQEELFVPLIVVENRG